MACVTFPASAQAPPSGTRVRLSVPCDPNGAICVVAGAFVSSGEDSIRIASGQSTTGYGLSAVRRVEVSDGYRTHRALGAGIGFVAGAGITYVVTSTGGSTSPCDRSANQDALSSTECLGLAAVGGVAGAGLGFLIGGLFRSERWRNVPLEQFRLSLAPGRIGFGLRAAL
jgi:hypothetical protein